MIHGLPFLFVLAFGFLLFGIFYQRNPSKNSPLEWVIIFWLGMGLCVLIVFGNLLCFNRYEPYFVKLWSIASLLILMGVYYLRLSRFTLSLKESFALMDWLQWGLLASVAGGMMCILSMYNPYGDWDAWSFWNFRARYLYHSGSHWQDILTHMSQAKHPWFLPFWTVFGWAWGGAESAFFPRLSSQIFALIVLASVYFGLLELGVRRIIAFLGGLCLVSLSIFIIRSISQYADVVLAGLISINMLVLLRIYKRSDPKDMIVFAFLLGQMVFVKDEGFACFLMFLVLTFLIGMHKKGWPYLLFLGVLAAAFIPTVIMKYWMWSIPGSSLHVEHLFELARWKIILQHSCKQISHPMFGALFILPVIAIFLWFYGRWDKICSLMASFMIMFIALFVLLYILADGDLFWRLSVSSFRLIFQIIPIFLIFLFYNISIKKKLDNLNR